MARKRKKPDDEPQQEAKAPSEERKDYDPERARLVPRSKIGLAVSILALSAWTLFLAWIAYQVNF